MAKLLFDKVFFIVLAVFLIASCSSPNVQQSFISPETKDIEIWYIRHITQNAASDSLPSISATRDNLGIDDNIDRYIEAVEFHLMDKGIIISDSTPVSGIINLKVNDPGITGRLTYVKKEWNAPYEYQKPPPGIRDSADVYFKETGIRPINYNEIEILSSDGRFLGKATIDGQKIKPEFTARVIKELIKNGEY